ncbi:gamma-secretase subunit PEN-2 [Lepeophtheirus salmonis]|uniref:gamma-secretase subunit PEN-2 n=1 Tax=Lepeophtheirus salmonis TaxID=72036 RepID=UPI001AE631DE|nr:gamma-secretase subunit PEN-2-like [Lepeophtheirus salmonis]
MDLSSAKVSDEDRVTLCRKYFIAGFCFLPFAWFVNVLWFYPQGFRREDFPGRKSIRKMVIGSAIGASLWTAAFISWIIVFYNYRASWGPLGDRMSFNIPIGIP